MKEIIDHHHYRSKEIPNDDYVAKYERYVIDTLLNSELDDDQRESSIAFELKHHHSTAQFARVLAKKRNMPENICTVGALLHDFYVIKFGKYEDHAHRSAELASSIIDEIGGFSSEEKNKIIQLIYNHSDKQVWSDNPYAEFGKDVDILDSFLYPGAFGYYLKHKRLSVFYNYILRAKRVWEELNIPQPKCFDILNNYHVDWLDKRNTLSRHELLYLLCSISEMFERINIRLPSFCFRSIEKGYALYINGVNQADFLKSIELLFGLKIDSSFETDWERIFRTILGNDESRLSRFELLLEVPHEKAVMIWSGLNSYEILDTVHDKKRLIELGISDNVIDQ